MTQILEALADDRIRGGLELAEMRQRVQDQARRDRVLRRARRLERTAERRLIRAWRRAAQLRARAESAPP